MRHIKLEIMDNPISPDSCLGPNGEECEFLYRHWRGYLWWCNVFQEGLSYDNGPVRCHWCKSSEVAR